MFFIMQSICYLLLFAALRTTCSALSLSVDYQSLVWSTNITNYWSPIQLKATSYQYESPAGTLPDPLNKRGEECNPGLVLLRCRVITVNSSISPVTEATLSDILGTYQEIDDV
jgi:hypothetical protein